MGADLKVDVFGNCKIYLRNLGTDDVPIELIDFSIDGKPVSISPAIGIIKKDAVQGINFLNLDPGRYKLLIKIYDNAMDWGFLTCTGPSIACHSDADCQEKPDNPCTIDVCNSPGTPASSCSHTPITACIDGDGCCPMGCTALNDNDCGAVCGNGVIEGAEECDGVNLAGQTCVRARQEIS